MNALALAAGLSVARFVSPDEIALRAASNDRRSDACAGTCDRCGVSAWHPEVRACTETDCELRHARVEPRGGDG